jgi:uncharacterized integral membrane protein
LSFCQNCNKYIGEEGNFCPFCGAKLIEKKAEQPAPKGYDHFYTEPRDTQYPSAYPPSKSTTSEQAQVGKMREKYTYKETLPHLETRNYWIWFLLMFLFSPMGLIYTYVNLEDLKKLDKYPRPSYVPSTYVDPTKWIIILIVTSFIGLSAFVSIYINYLKFEKLHNYIKAHPQKQSTIPASGNKIIWLSILGFLPGLVALILVLIFALIPLATTSDPYAFLYSFSYPVGILIAISALAIVSIPLSIIRLFLNARWQEAYNERVLMIDPTATVKYL